MVQKPAGVMKKGATHTCGEPGDTGVSVTQQDRCCVLTAEQLRFLRAPQQQDLGSSHLIN